MPVSFSLSSSSATTQPTSAFPSEYRPKGPCEVKSIRSFAEDKYKAILDSRELRSDKAKLLNFLEGLTNDIIGLDKSRARNAAVAAAAAEAANHLYVPAPLPADLRIPSQSSLSRIKQLRGSFDARDGAGLAAPSSSYRAPPAAEQVRPFAASASANVPFPSSSNVSTGNNTTELWEPSKAPVSSGFAAAESGAAPASPVRPPCSPKKESSAASAAPPLKYTDEVDLSSTRWRPSGGTSRPMAALAVEENQRSLDLSDLTASRMEELKRV